MPTLCPSLPLWVCVCLTVCLCSHTISVHRSHCGCLHVCQCVCVHIPSLSIAPTVGFCMSASVSVYIPSLCPSLPLWVSVCLPVCLFTYHLSVHRSHCGFLYVCQCVCVHMPTLCPSLPLWVCVCLPVCLCSHANSLSIAPTVGLCMSDGVSVYIPSLCPSLPLWVSVCLTVCLFTYHLSVHRSHCGFLYVCQCVCLHTISLSVAPIVGFCLSASASVFTYHLCPSLPLWVSVCLTVCLFTYHISVHRSHCGFLFVCQCVCVHIPSLSIAPTVGFCMSDGVSVYIPSLCPSLPLWVSACLPVCLFTYHLSVHRSHCAFPYVCLPMCLCVHVNCHHHSVALCDLWVCCHCGTVRRELPGRLSDGESAKLLQHHEETG